MEMKDYQIIQRDENNMAKARFCGLLPKDALECVMVYARVFGETDNLTIVPFQRCIVKNGQWEIQITLPAGGLYGFEAKMIANEKEDLYWARRIKLVRHFGVGDLYLLTGQSNMAGYGRDVAYDPPTLGVHLYANNGSWCVAAHPLNDSIDTIYPENCELSSATSPALSFARTLKEKLNIPIGLVQASLGGSPLSAWHPEEDGYLYRGMMRRIDVVGNVRGILWYQGCSDANKECCNTYYERFKRMIELWREMLGNVPVITVQLNRWATNGISSLENDRSWGIIRDAQRRLADDMFGVSIVTVSDLPMSDGIHNSTSANIVIGHRMAMVAMKNIYKQRGQSAPALRSCEYVDETHLKLTFDSNFCMCPPDRTAYGLDVEDESGIIACKKAVGGYGVLELETDHPYTLPARFHAYWRSDLPSLLIRDYIGMPMLSCYNVEITGLKTNY